MRRRGFTLVEILMVVVILAAMAGIAFAGLNKAKYKTEKNQAITYLRAIRTAQKLYWPSWKAYACSTTCTGVTAVNTALGVEIKLTNWNFVVASGTSTTFTATATSDAASGSKTLILNEAGTWSGTYTPLPTV